MNGWIIGSLDGGGVDFVDGASVFGEHEYGELGDIVDVEGVAEGGGDVGVSVSVKLLSFVAAGVDFAV